MPNFVSECEANNTQGNCGLCRLQCRNTIRAFEQQGLECLSAESSRPRTVKQIFGERQREHLRQLLHTSPRTFGKSRSSWTLDSLAEVGWEQEITEKQVSCTTLKQALKTINITWSRAKA